MAKINLDKYYTDPAIVELCLTELAKLNLPITEYLEPSAGAGAFSFRLPEGSLAYDIEPEHESIIRQDFLKLELPYKEGRCVIGNPPFGSRNLLSNKFYTKAIELADFIAFIQPIGQLNNTTSMYKFDLIHSIELPIIPYSGVTLHCCFNVYRRPKKGLNLPAKKHPFKDLYIGLWTRGKGNSEDTTKGTPCYAINAWGDIGKVPMFKGQYAYEMHITCWDSNLEARVVEVCKTTDWSSLCNSVSTKKLQVWRVYKYLKEQIPELQ